MPRRKKPIDLLAPIRKYQKTGLSEALGLDLSNPTDRKRYFAVYRRTRRAEAKSKPKTERRRKK